MHASQPSQEQSGASHYSREMLILQSASATIMSSLDLQQVLKAVTGEMVNLLDAEACTIFDWDQPNNKVVALARYTSTPQQNESPPPEIYKLDRFPRTKQVLTEQLTAQITVTGPSADPLRLTHVREDQVKAVLMLPLMFRERVIGLVDVTESRQARVFSDQQVALAKLLANQAAIAIENARLHTETERRTQQLTVLQKLDRAITVSLRISDVYYAFASHVAQLLSYDHMSITLVENNRLRVAYVAGKNARMRALSVGETLPYHTSAVGWVVGQGQPLVRHNIATDTRFVEDNTLAENDIRAHMIIPLRNKGKVIGTWNIGSRQVGVYTPDDLGMAWAVADQLAIAIANAKSYEQAQQEIAERKRAEAALEEERSMLAHRVAEQTADLRAINAQLARTARLKDEFLASVSHELRTPLTAILGLCDVLQAEIYGSLNQKQLSSIQNIEESGRHLLSLINDILDLSKVEANELELEIGPVAVEPVCQASLIFVKQLAYKKRLKVSFSFDSAIPIIYADERRIKQILVNLLSNAVKFTPEGGAVGLEVNGDTRQQIVHFKVWDTGIGISEEEIGKLFHPFVQLDSTLSRQFSGTGLGLALVDRMTKLHGGIVSVESKVDEGSCFTVSLPQSNLETKGQRPALESAAPARPDPSSTPNRDEQTTAAKQAAVSTATQSTRPPPFPLILIAEDDESIANLLTDYLRAQNFRIVAVQNGAEALAKAKLERPSLILMDMQMPEMDGLTATRRLRADPALKDIPIIALTARAMADERKRCLAAGVNDYLSKPVSLKTVLKAIEAQLESGESE